MDDALKIANKKHDLVALQIYDEREKELPDAGLVRFRHAETGEIKTIDTSNKEFRMNYKKNWDLKQRQLAESFARSGVDQLWRIAPCKHQLSTCIQSICIYQAQRVCYS